MGTRIGILQIQVTLSLCIKYNNGPSGRLGQCAMVALLTTCAGQRQPSPHKKSLLLGVTIPLKSYPVLGGGRGGTEKNSLAMLPHFVLDTKSGKQCHYKDPFWLESHFMLVVPRFLTLLAYFTALAIKQRQFSSCHECPTLTWVYIGKRKFYTWTEVCLLMFGS